LANAPSHNERLCPAGEYLLAETLLP
jgi:hypothetical protein